MHLSSNYAKILIFHKNLHISPNYAKICIYYQNMQKFAFITKICKKNALISNIFKNMHLPPKCATSNSFLCLISIKLLQKTNSTSYLKISQILYFAIYCNLFSKKTFKKKNCRCQDSILAGLTLPLSKRTP